MKYQHKMMSDFVGIDPKAYNELRSNSAYETMSHIPERDLIEAVVLRTIVDLKKETQNAALSIDAIIDLINTPSDETHHHAPFSLAWILAELGMERSTFLDMVDRFLAAPKGLARSRWRTNEQGEIVPLKLKDRKPRRRGRPRLEQDRAA